MRKLILTTAAMAFMLTACTNNDTTQATAEPGTATPAENTANKPAATVPPADSLAVDDSVFADGSRPANWENAGITDVRALKLFILELQQLVAADKKEAVAQHVRYPFHKTVASRAEFIAL